MIRIYLILCGMAFSIGLCTAGLGVYRYMHLKVAAVVATAAAEKVALEDARDDLQQALTAAQEQRKKDVALLERRMTERTIAARLMASLQQKLAAALAINREWADTPVPKEVRDALEQP